MPNCKIEVSLCGPVPWTGLVHCKESILDTFCAFVDLCIRGFKCYESHSSRFRQSTTALFRQAIPSQWRKVRRNVLEIQGGSGTAWAWQDPSLAVWAQNILYCVYRGNWTYPDQRDRYNKDSDGDWLRTIRVYRVYKAWEAVLRAARSEDVLDGKAQVKAWGRDSLTRIAAEHAAERRIVCASDRLFWSVLDGCAESCGGGPMVTGELQGRQTLHPAEPLCRGEIRNYVHDVQTEN